MELEYWVVGKGGQVFERLLFRRIKFRNPAIATMPRHEVLGIRLAHAARSRGFFAPEPHRSQSLKSPRFLVKSALPKFWYYAPRRTPIWCRVSDVALCRS